MAKSPDAFRTIREVAEWLDTPAHVLRFWESRFNQVKPVKRAGGRRYYRPADMLLIGGIKKLLHVDGMTIKGVQKLLRTEGVKSVAALSQPILDERLAKAAAVQLETDPPGETIDVEAEEVSVPEPVEEPGATTPQSPTMPAPDMVEPEAETPAQPDPIPDMPTDQPEPVTASAPEPEPEPEPAAFVDEAPHDAPDPEPSVPLAPPIPHISVPPDPDDDDDQDIEDPVLAALLRTDPQALSTQSAALKPIYDKLHDLRSRME